MRRDLATGLLVAVIGSATVALLAVRGDVGQGTWIPVLSWPQVVSTLVMLAGHARALLLPAVAGLVVVAATARRGGELAFGPALAAAWLLVPLGLAAAISAVKPLLVPRYLLVAQPGFLLLVALGLCALRRPRLIALAALLALALEGRELLIRPRTRDPLWQPIDEVAARLIEVSRPGDALVVNHPALARSLDREFRRLGYDQGLAGETNVTRVEPVQSKRCEGCRSNRGIRTGERRSTPVGRRPGVAPSRARGIRWGSDSPARTSRVGPGPRP